ncbi:probable CCR4-associated factor 1 homolog 9 [Telopea speciosissima]|uniref:probable CCR4-associated factor 1 homolog 9 n=1 Tax=Telopea speciosissima TaxID=54955 RepID=UPI001CC5BAA2|nr:probable CCR4-associated factor 1 homolog 9 [Telopea speciosissima]
MGMTAPLLEPQYKKSIRIINVWSSNLEFEFERIAFASRCFPFVTIDTEFPGVVFHPTVDSANPKNTSRPLDRYRALKANVDSLHLIQLGLTLSDLDGNLPDFGGGCSFVWQINFKEFDVSSDLHAPDSINLLRQQGIKFDKNREDGVDSTRFAELMLASGLVFYNTPLFRWVTFHGAYDFAYLLKAITRQPLPDDLNGFYKLLNVYFGLKIYDVKQMLKFCDGVFGGLERVAKTYGLKRIGEAHCAGSDSLLTWFVFHKLLLNNNVKGAGVLFGLDIDYKPAPVIRFMAPVPPQHAYCSVLRMPAIPGMFG